MWGLETTSSPEARAFGLCSGGQPKSRAPASCEGESWEQSRGEAQEQGCLQEAASVLQDAQASDSADASEAVAEPALAEPAVAEPAAEAAVADAGAPGDAVKEHLRFRKEYRSATDADCGHKILTEGPTSHQQGSFERAK